MQQQSNQNFEGDRAQLLNDCSPHNDNHVTQQIAAIIRGKMYGIHPVSLMTNIINKHKTGDLTASFPYYSPEQLEEEFINLLNRVSPIYGDPISDEIAEILEMKSVGIDVEALQRNVLSKYYQIPNEVVHVASDSDE